MIIRSLAASLAFGLLPLADIFVDQNAATCAVGSGSAADPVCTIGAAIGLVAPGDTIHIAPGNYIENVVIGMDLNLVGTGGASVTTIDGGAVGSVISVTGATSTVDGLTLTNGRASLGGGLSCTDSVVTLLNSTISGSTAFGGITTGGIGNGGGASATNGVLEIRDSTILGNTAYFSGGGVCVSGARLVMEGTTICGNSADFGGGVTSIQYDGSAGPELTNCTVSSNDADRAGGLILTVSGGGFAPPPVLESVTITRNSALFGVGGAYFSPLVPTVIRNSIVAENEVLTTGEPDVDGGANSLGHNLIGVGGAGFVDGVGGDQVGSALTPLDPFLGPLVLSSGPTATHALLVGSPAIDLGDPLFFETLDQQGASRPKGFGPDIGAVESPGPSLYRNLCNGDGGDQMGCTNCPCGNNAPAGTIGGCLNSHPRSTRLAVSGDPSVSLPAMSSTDLRFALTGAPSSAFCILNSGDGVGPANLASPCFGLESGTQALQFDGLRCAIQNTRRHGGRLADPGGDVGVNSIPWGGEGGPSAGIAGAGAGFVSGQTRFFQVITRDLPTAGCMRGLNTSQAIEVVFAP